MATLSPTAFERQDPRQVPLSQFGYDQSVRVGNFVRDRRRQMPQLQDRPLDFRYSPYLRIAQTKDGVIEGLGGEVPYTEQPEPLLEERDHGHFDGIVDEAKRRAIDPAVCDILESGDRHANYHVRMPGGESLEDVVERARRFTQKSMTESPDSDLFVVTHGANFRAIEKVLMDHSEAWFMGRRPPWVGDLHFIDRGEEGRPWRERIFINQRRTPSLPKNYKTAPYDPEQRGWQIG